MSSATSFVLVIFTIISLAFIPNDASESPAESYWKAKLGNIPMPKVLKDSLQQGPEDGSVNVNLMNYGHNSMDHDFETLAPKSMPAFSFSRISYKRGFTGTQLPQDGRVMYFTDETLFKKGGAKMKLDFIKTDNEAKFLPKSMPAFSSSKIQRLLSVNPNSIAAQDIEKTIKECADNGVKGEVRYCATSLEGMVDYVRNKNFKQVLSMEHDIKSLMEYRVQKARKIEINSRENKYLVCHKMTNPYAVFLCHNIKNTNMYDVSLVGVNGKQLKAVVACHMDTSSWNPKHLAFQLLKIKPGSKPICHFLSGNDMVWIPN